MIQPFGILQFWNSLDETYEHGFYSDICVTKVPLLANEDLLLPFQIKRAVTGASITTFELQGHGCDDVDLIADVANIEIHEFVEGFEQLIYTAQIDLSATVPEGFYNIHISDGANDWYSNPFEVGDYPLASFDFGAFSDGFSNGFLIEGITITSVGEFYIFTFLNFKDLFNKVYQFSYNDILVLDGRHMIEDNFSEPVQEIVMSEDTGKEIIENIYYQDEVIVSFYHNKDVGEFMKLCVALDKITIVDQYQVEKVITQFDVVVENTNTPELVKIMFKYKENYINKNAINVDY